MGATTKSPETDWRALRDRLSSERGQAYWRSLEELADSEGFRELIENEFPQGASEWIDPVSRRRFLTLSAASLALAGLSACTRQPTEKILPYVQPPEELVPGEPLYYATALELRGTATGLLVESHTGRPTKIEGNEQHPASLGSTDAITQASLLDLYDPDRSQNVRNAGEISTWEAFVVHLNDRLADEQQSQGAGIRLLTHSVSSPTLLAHIAELLEAYPKAKWHHYEPLSRDNVWAGARAAFGRDAEPRYQLEQADVILSLDADFLSFGPGHVRYTRDFSARRRVSADSGPMNRLYVVEPTPSLTGAMADHRLALRMPEIEATARALAREIGLDLPAVEIQTPAAWIRAVAKDLLAHRGRSLVMAGEHQPPAVHALAHAMNEILGNTGKTVVYQRPVIASPQSGPLSQSGSFSELVRDMDSGNVDLLVILDANPLYDAPADLAFAERLSNVDFIVHLGTYYDETAERSHWHIPEAHYLESWADTRAFDGTLCLVQPLIEPLYQGKSPLEMISALLGRPNEGAYDILRRHWSRQQPGVAWEKTLHDGLAPGTVLAPMEPKVLRDIGTVLSADSSGASSGWELVFRPDPSVLDGRFANNGWLQETPRPLSKITWENAALMAPADTERLGLENGDVVEIRSRSGSVEAPVWKLPGQAQGTVTAHLGYGRRRSGRVGTGIGFDAYSLRSSASPWREPGIEIRKVGKRIRLASTQNHQVMEGRHLIRQADWSAYQEHPDFAQALGHEPDESATLYNTPTTDGNAWGMVIDLNACTGCNACTVACQSENNIPVVGKTEVQRGREMHWIRVDRYFEGDLDQPAIAHQPVPCMQCENAPCEPVCPVGATAHGPEGLNEMVYNRCVGTRYCANNCPYKVRRFNFLHYSDDTTPAKKLMRNPDVTVRTRGVMEKCTYCVQRINLARIQAKREDRSIRDGDIVTACQAVCPAEAIVFGDIHDSDSRVAKLKADPRNYGILTELNVRPRTTYLARLRNPNPDIEESE